MKKQKRSITIKIDDEGNPKEKFDPTPYLESYIRSWHRQLRGKIQDRIPLDPNGFPSGLYCLDSGVSLTAEATWISTLSPYQASLGRVCRRARSRTRKCAELCRLGGNKILGIIDAVVPPKLLKLLLRRDR